MTEHKNSPPDLYRTRYLIDRVLSTQRRRTPGAAQRAARSVAAANGRDDPHYIRYLVALSDLTGRSRTGQLRGVREMADLLAIPEFEADARAALRTHADHAAWLSRFQARRALGADRPGWSSTTPWTNSWIRRRAEGLPLLGGIADGLALVAAAIRTEPWLFGLALAGTIVFGGLTVVTGPLVDGLVTLAFDGRIGAADLVLPIGLVLLVFGLRAAAQFAVGYGVPATQARLAGHSRRDLIRHLARLSPAWHRRQSLDHVSATVMSDPDLGWRPLRALVAAVGASVGVACGIVVLVALDWRLAVVGLLLIAVLAAFNVAYLRRIRPHVATAAALRDEIWRLAGQIGPPGPNARPAPADQVALFEETSGRLKDTMRRVHRVRGMFNPWRDALPGLAVLAAIAMLAVPQSGDPAVAGDIVTASVLFAVAGLPIRAVGSALAETSASARARRGVRELLIEQAVMPYGTATPALPDPVPVRFDGVTFAYKDGEPVFSDVSVDIPAGQVVALIGAPGSGKSTMAMLASRRMDPSAGSIRINGEDLRTLSRESLDGLVGYVAQRPVRPSGSVRSAVVLGRSGIDDADVWRALRLAGEEPYLNRQGLGLDAPLSTSDRRVGAHRSVRLALAAALAGRPRLLVLDHSVDSLDLSPTALRRIRDDGGATVLVATTRPTLVAEADTVLYLDESGRTHLDRHQSLLRNSRPYAALISAYEKTPGEAVLSLANPRPRLVVNQVTVPVSKLDQIYGACTYIKGPGEPGRSAE